VRTLLALSLVLLSSCGYIMHGSTQKVQIDTVPTNAAVEVDGRPYTTPVELELGRSTLHTVTTRSTYGAPLASHVQSDTQWRSQVVDCVTCPIIGNIIDGVSGGDSELVPTQLVIPLEKPQATP